MDDKLILMQLGVLLIMVILYYLFISPFFKRKD